MQIHPSTPRAGTRSAIEAIGSDVHVITENATRTTDPISGRLGAKRQFCAGLRPGFHLGVGRSVPHRARAASPGRLGRGPAAVRGQRAPQESCRNGPPLGFPITNSMLVTWVVAASLIIFAQVATRRMEPVPQ